MPSDECPARMCILCQTTINCNRTVKFTWRNKIKHKIFRAMQLYRLWQEFDWKFLENRTFSQSGEMLFDSSKNRTKIKIQSLRKNSVFSSWSSQYIWAFLKAIRNRKVIKSNKKTKMSKFKTNLSSNQIRWFDWKKKVRIGNGLIWNGHMFVCVWAAYTWNVMIDANFSR